MLIGILVLFISRRERKVSNGFGREHGCDGASVRSDNSKFVGEDGEEGVAQRLRLVVELDGEEGGEEGCVEKVELGVVDGIVKM